MPSRMESCRVGSITWSNRYFADQDFSIGAFQRAEVAAKAVLDEVTNAYPREGWDIAYGSAGTVGAVADVLAAAGWPTESITPAGLDWLVEKLISAQSAERLRLPGLKDDRRALIGGGLSILRAVFDLLQIDRMVLNPGGLRHGLLAELMGQVPEQSDLRARSVARLAVKFGAESAQSQRVGRVARNFLNALVVCKPPSEALATERLHRKLNWAADLHEIGSHISHSDYHKHGAYILDNADAMGFTQSELHRLSLLVLGHRGKLRKLGADFNDTAFIFQLLALRLAVILCHARNDPVTDGLLLSTSGDADQRISLHYAQAWGNAFPQSLHLLQEEVIAWQKTPWSLQLTEENP
jgi:exopolyphosphatase/guanosine-5'-triphosphate,3'-diphosphate pyrophosphatase